MRGVKKRSGCPAGYRLGLKALRRVALVSGLPRTGSVLPFDGRTLVLVDRHHCQGTQNTSSHHESARLLWTPPEERIMLRGGSNATKEASAVQPRVQGRSGSSDHRGDQSLTQVARDLDVGPNVLRRWKQQLTEATGGDLPLDEAEELRQLRKENAKLRMEREILKKAVAIFSEFRR